MGNNNDKGFSLIELLVVLFMISAIAYFGWEAFNGWRERNAVRMVSQDVKFALEKYRQRAINKGYNYGLIFSENGLYVFEDNGGDGSQPFKAMNNFAIDAGEYSDKTGTLRGSSSQESRLVTISSDEFKYINDTNARRKLMVMTASTLGIGSVRSGTAYDTSSNDITSQTVVAPSDDSTAPFSSGSLALFFCPDGNVYLKDPTVPIKPTDRYLYQLGNGVADNFYIVRVAFDDPLTSKTEVPNYYEIAVNRYGASTYVMWHEGASGAWNAEVQ